MEKLTLEFQAKQPYKTYWLNVTGPIDSPEWDRVSAAMKGLGWEEKLLNTPTATEGWRQYTLPGTGMFNGWTDDEKDLNLGKAAQALSGFKLTYRNMTLADLL